MILGEAFFRTGWWNRKDNIKMGRFKFICDLLFNIGETKPNFGDNPYLRNNGLIV